MKSYFFKKTYLALGVFLIPFVSFANFNFLSVGSGSETIINCNTTSQMCTFVSPEFIMSADASVDIYVTIQVANDPLRAITPSQSFQKTLKNRDIEQAVITVPFSDLGGLKNFNAGNLFDVYFFDLNDATRRSASISHDFSLVINSPSHTSTSPSSTASSSATGGSPSSSTQTSATSTTPQTQVPTCGSANGQSFANRPTTNLCGAGSYPVGIITTPTGGWSWRCSLGIPNSNPVSCSASKTGTSNNQTTTQNQSAGQSQTDTTNTGSTQTGNTGSNQTLTGSGVLKNPLPYDSIPEIIQAVVNNIVLPVAVPFIGIMIMYSGFLFVVARKKGSIADYDKAKNTLKYTLIGAALILGAFVIANALQGTLNALIN